MKVTFITVTYSQKSGVGWTKEVADEWVSVVSFVFPWVHPRHWLENWKSSWSFFRPGPA